MARFPMQVDWISGEVSSPSILGSGLQLYNTGRVLVCAPDGSVSESWASSTSVPSHDTSLRVRSPDGSSLWLSGNPCKWFQGHNLFGSVNIDGLFLAAGLEVRQLAGLFPGPSTFLANQYARPRYTRIDLTRSYRFASDADARAWLRDVASHARSRHGAPVLRGSTCSWGKGSSHWSMVAYLKSDELVARGKTHRLSRELAPEYQSLLLDWSRGVVRFELRLRRLELQSLGPIVDPLAVWQNYFDRITFNRNSDGFDMATATLPNHLQGYLARWERGEDLRRSVSKPTFYRTRRALLKDAGIDIASPPPARDKASPTPSELSADGWDPEPIDELLYEPGDDLAKQYGLID